VTAAVPVSTDMAPLAPTLAWLADRAALEDDARDVLAAAPPADPGAAARALLAAGQAPAAIRFLAGALPPREGIWWSWVSARHAIQVATAAQTRVPPAVTNALNAVERWIGQPADDTRRAAWLAGEAAGLDSAAGAAAGAVYFSGGSIAPADVMVVPPPAGLHSTLIAVAVTIAAAADPASLDFVAGAYLDQATEIAKQLGGWDRSVASARQYHDAQQQQHDAFANAGKPKDGAAAPAQSSRGR
jgi:hypothetical protein